MTRSALSLILMLMGGLGFGAGCGQIAELASTGPPPTVLGPAGVLLRTPNSSGNLSFEVAVAFSPDGRTVAVGRVESLPEETNGISYGTVVSLCDVASRRERATIRGPIGEACGVAFAPDGETLAVGLDREIRLHDFREWGTPGDSDGRWRVRYARPGVLARWPAPRQYPVPWLFEHLGPRHEPTIGSTRPPHPRGRGGRHLARRDPGGHGGPGGGRLPDELRPVRVFDIASGRQRFEWEQGSTARSVAFSPDGRWLASGGGATKLWDLATGECRTLIEPGSGLAVYAVAFSPDGGTLAIGLGSANFEGSAGEVRLWDVAHDRVRAVLQGEAGKIRTLAFAPDGKSLVTASREVTTLWDLGSSTPR